MSDVSEKSPKLDTMSRIVLSTKNPIAISASVVIRLSFSHQVVTIELSILRPATRVMSVSTIGYITSESMWINIFIHPVLPVA
jgi:hypothetical protein